MPNDGPYTFGEADVAGAEFTKEFRDRMATFNTGWHDSRFTQREVSKVCKRFFKGFLQR